jgi:capsular exopolysaccharide synthesis family protein
MSVKLSKRDVNDMELGLVTFKSPKSMMSETYRVLRTNLGFAGVEQPFKTVLITSALAMEGKSTTVANLAVVTAQAGYRVILVDCDLRRPRMHKIFQIPNDMGFTNCIINEIEPERVAHSSSTHNLQVLTSGPIPPNPAEVLNSMRARNMWSYLKERNDYVFIDSPPLLSVTDAAIIASQVDASLLVVLSGKTRNEAAVQAKDRLVQANARIIGVVLNQSKPNGQDNYYYY